MTSEQNLIDKALRFLNHDIVEYAFEKKIDTATAEKLTEHADLDKGLFYYSEMLAKIGMRDGFEGYRSDMIPRLKGLYRFERVRHAVNISRFETMCRTLQNAGIDFICGRFLSVLFSASDTDILDKATEFDIVVRQKQYEKARAILSCPQEQIIVNIAVCDDLFAWKNYYILKRNGYKFKVLNPTGILFCFGLQMCGDFCPSKIYTADAFFDRYRCLYQFKRLTSMRMPVDFRGLHRHAGTESACAIRFFLECQYNYFNEQNDKILLETFFPNDDRYQAYLEELERRISL